MNKWYITDSEGYLVGYGSGKPPATEPGLRLVMGEVPGLEPLPTGGGVYRWNVAERVWEDIEEKGEAVRRTRQAKLKASDWTQLPDVPLATKETWATYRQALRDITEQPGFPERVVWPKPPS